MSAADADILRRARARIEDPSRWTVRAQARDEQGYVVQPTDERAVCWCAVGAAKVEGGKGFLSALTMLHSAATDLGDEDAGPYNDRGHEYALRMIDKAIELAEAS